jgi:hypothetical protein
LSVTYKGFAVLSEKLRFKISIALQINTIYKSSGAFSMPVSKAKVDYRHSGSIHSKSSNRSSSCRHRYWTGNFAEYPRNKLCPGDFRCGKKTLHNRNWSFHSRSLTLKAMILSYMSVMSSSFLCRCFFKVI